MESERLFRTRDILLPQGPVAETLGPASLANEEPGHSLKKV